MIFVYKKMKFSKYNDLSKVYDINNPYKIIKEIPSPLYYYDPQYDECLVGIPSSDGKFKKYSILGLVNNDSYYYSYNDTSEAALIKSESNGVVALKIPYLKLIKLCAL